MMKKIRVPATTANLGPGFDTLGMALSIWNEADLSAAGKPGQITISVEGFGAETLPLDGQNLVVKSAHHLLLASGVESTGLHFHCRNNFPGSSGLGSSSSAILLGLVGANAFLSEPLSYSRILDIANELEGHPDNVTPALLGGLTISVLDDEKVVVRKVTPSKQWLVGIVVPSVSISTNNMRAALKHEIPMSDAVFNISRALLVVQAFEQGDISLLKTVMDDRLHQPYRLPLIPGAGRAIEAAAGLGLPAALSGAGPGVVVFGQDEQSLRTAVTRMKTEFESQALSTWDWVGAPDMNGTQLT